MKRPIKWTLIVLAVILLALFFFLSWMIGSENKDVIKKSLNCSAEDYKYAEEMGDYDPQEAYDFGVKIQSLVKEKNLEGIFNLVDESGGVPRKSLALKYSFDEIFDADWVNSVIKFNSFDLLIQFSFN